MHRRRHLLPYLATAAGVGLFSLMDALMKSASLAMGVFTALFLRSVFGTLMILPLWQWRGGRWPGRHALRMHVLRGAVSTGMVALFFFSLVRLPIAEAIALTFMAPLLTLYLAAVLLGEEVGRRAVFASLLGLAGVVVIAGSRFHSGTLDSHTGWGMVAVAGSALLYAWNLILQRQVALIASPAEATLGQNGVMTLLLLPFAPWFLTMPAPVPLAETMLAALLASVSLLLLSWAYARAQTQALVPLEYSAFLWALLFGWLFFGEKVAPATYAGAASIMVACWIAAPSRGRTGRDEGKPRLAEPRAP